MTREEKAHRILIAITPTTEGYATFTSSFDVRELELLDEDLDHLATILAQYHNRVQHMLQKREKSSHQKPCGET